MQIKRELEVTLSASRRYIIRQLNTNNSLSPCPQCGEPMVTAEQAGKVIGVNQRRVFQIIEAGTVHFTETEGGTTLICIASMSNDAEGSPAHGSDPAHTGPQSPLSEGTTT